MTLAGLQELYRSRGRLFSLHIDLTWRCPLRCIHCYLEGRDGRRRAGGELGTAEWLKVLEDARRLGVFVLVLSGGDPMARRDFFEILEAARAMRFLVRVKTSGVRMGAATARRIARLGHVIVEVSVHGATPEVHDRVAGVAGAHEKTMAAIRHLKDAGVRVRVFTVAMSCNVAETEEVLARCEDMGVEGQAFVVLHPKTASGPIDSLVAPMADRVRLLERLAPGLPAAMRSPDPRGPLCGAGHTTLYVSPRGVVQPCATWPLALGDAREGLAAVLAGDTARRVRGLRHADRAGCIGCERLSACPFCPGISFSVHGDATRPNPASCGQAEVRLRVRERAERAPIAPAGAGGHGRVAEDSEVRK